MTIRTKQASDSLVISIPSCDLKTCFADDEKLLFLYHCKNKPPALSKKKSSMSDYTGNAPDTPPLQKIPPVAGSFVISQNNLQLPACTFSTTNACTPFLLAYLPVTSICSAGCLITVL